MEIQIGDAVYLQPPWSNPEYPYYIAIVEMFFEDWKGVKRFRGRWLRRFHDIKTITTGEHYNVLCRDHQELYLSDEFNNVSTQRL